MRRVCTALPHAPSFPMDFAGRYRAELGDLTLNSRPLIGTLTTLAGEAAGVAAPDVAAAVLDRVETVSESEGEARGGGAPI